MAFGFSSGWIYLWIFVQSTNLWADSASPPRYTIHRAQVSFDRALGACSPGGLATLATEQEVSTVLGLISELLLPQTEFAFWVGLKKAKNKCVVPSSPLRGFSWIGDDSEDSPGIPWAKEPQDTCTTVRCVVLQGKRDGLSGTSWGLSPVTCRDSSVHQFICKLRDGQTRLMSEEGMSTIKPTSLEPVTRGVKPVELEPPETESKPPMREPVTDLNFKAEPDPGPDSGSVVVSNLCQRPVIPRARALRLDPNNSSRIQVECWSDYQLDLHCWGRPDVWRLGDESPANLTILCVPCGAGFRKDGSGNCVDLDECTDAPCRHTCVNTEGSFMCVCPDQDGRHHDEGSPACTPAVPVDDRGSVWGIWIPVLVAVATLVLLVLVAVTVKCCLMRNARKRALKGSDKMVMKNEDNQA